MIACTRSRLSTSSRSARLRAVTSCTCDDQVERALAARRGRATRSAVATIVSPSARRSRFSTSKLGDLAGQHPGHVARVGGSSSAGSTIALEARRRPGRSAHSRDLAERAVDPQEAARAIALDAHQRHPDRRLVERAPEALLGLVHRRLVALARGDVAQHRGRERARRPRSSARTLPRAGTRPRRVVAPRAAPAGNLDERARARRCRRPARRRGARR